MTANAGKPLSRGTRAPAGAAIKTINLALQGGGAHGAFTWGVLDRLLEDERIAYDGIVATSAGAMNAAVMVSGMAVGGARGAREALATFWRRISESARMSPLQPSFLDRMSGNHGMDNSPVFMMFDMMTRVFSPYQFNPMNHNPLRSVLERSVDFEAIHQSTCPVKIFLCATNVRTGKVKVFDNAELSADAVLASACLPFLFQAVEIDGEAYWDGGYMGNPAIFPLIYNCDSRDVLIIHINPLNRTEVPTTATGIFNRISEISFNSSLMREMRAIAFVTSLIDEHEELRSRLKKMLVHSISADDVMLKLGVASKFNADWTFLTHLRDAGRDYAAAWIEDNFEHLGERSSADIAATFL